MADHPEVREIQHQFGLTPKGPNGSSAIPAHLRTSSTQVEPSTPPKWMTFAEAEEKVKEANRAWSNSQASDDGGVHEVGPHFKKNKKERPTGISLSCFPEYTGSAYVRQMLELIKSQCPT